MREMRWTVLGDAERADFVRARCSCGTEREVRRRQIAAGRSTSCGCSRKDERIPLVERLASKVDVDGESGCWIWTGSRHQEGYGSIRHEGRTRATHRVAYEALVEQLDPALVLDHLCRNRPCINPDHMEPVTDAVNILRGISPAAGNAVKDRCINGHEFSPENTYLHRGRRNCRACNRLSAKRLYDGRRDA